MLVLVVGNSGPTVATDVRVTFSPPLRGQLETEAAVTRLAGGISSLPPGRTLAWALGSGLALVEGAGDTAHRCTVNATGPFGPLAPLEYWISLRDLADAQSAPNGTLYGVTSAIKDLSRTIGRARSV